MLLPSFQLCLVTAPLHCGEDFLERLRRLFVFSLGEAIPIYAEIENCSSRLVVPKAAILQTQTYLASGRTKTVQHVVARVRGTHVASGSTDTWNGKMLKIPPVTPSVLDCCIIRVDYSLAVSTALWTTDSMQGGTVTVSWSCGHGRLVPGETSFQANGTTANGGTDGNWPLFLSKN